MSSHADPNPAGWTDEEWAGMLRDAEAEVDSLKAENQQLREALRKIAATEPDFGFVDDWQAAYSGALSIARAAVGEE